MNKTNESVMYNLGDYVIYEQSGICKIVDIREEKFDKYTKKKFYILNPVFSSLSTVIYVPVDREDLNVHMQHLLTKEKINEIILNSNEKDIKWVEDSKARFDLYNEILKTGDRIKILRIIKSLSVFKLNREKEDKTFYVSDKRLLDTALKNITEEFSFVLSIEQDEVVPYIISMIEKTA